jgi:hypothetical protein
VARKIKEKIKRNVIIPGEVTIRVVREKIFIHKLNHKKDKDKVNPRKEDSQKNKKNKPN